MNRTDTRTTIGVCAFLAASVVPALLIHTDADAAPPNCGGKSAAPQPVPYDCVLPFKLIDGTQFAAAVHASGTSVTVVIALKTPRTVPTPARIVHHEGISGAGGTEDSAQGVIPPGALSITLTDSAPCRAGQLDIKAVFIGNGDANGRVSAPYVTTADNCGTTPTTTTTVPGTTVPSTTVPTTSIPDTSSSVPGSTVPGPTTSRPLSSVPGATSSRALPATGRSSTPLVLLAGLFLALGGLVLTVRRRAS